MHVGEKTKKSLLYITSLMWMFDAAGVLALSFTLPSISKEWALSVQQSANILSSTFLDMLVGALSVGFVADLFGRKLSNLIYFLMTILFQQYLALQTQQVPLWFSVSLPVSVTVV